MESLLQCFGSEITEAADISEAHWKKQKPPKEHEDLSEARYRYLLEILSHELLQKAEGIQCFKSLG